MSEPTFSDVEALVRAYLLPRVDGAPVATAVPKRIPPLFLRIVRTGGAAVNRVLERALITVTAYGGDSVSASELAGAARTALLAASGGMPLVRKVEERAGPYWDPDPDTGSARYTFTVELTVRAHTPSTTP